MLTDRLLVSQREIPLTLWDKRQRISDFPLLIPILEWGESSVTVDGRHIRSECRWSFDRYASRQRGADKPSPKSYLLEATYSLRKISALSGSLSPRSQSQSWVQTWVQLNPVWLCDRNTDSTNFYWWQEQKFYNLLMLCILSINETSTSSYFEVCGPANDKEISFAIPILISSAYLNTEQERCWDTSQDQEQGPDQIRQVRSGMRPTDHL